MRFWTQLRGRDTQWRCRCDDTENIAPWDEEAVARGAYNSTTQRTSSCWAFVARNVENNNFWGGSVPKCPLTAATGLPTTSETPMPCRCWWHETQRQHPPTGKALHRQGILVKKHFLLQFAKCLGLQKFECLDFPEVFNDRWNSNPAVMCHNLGRITTLIDFFTSYDTSLKTFEWNLCLTK